jgi:hypothetical protein
MFKRFAIGLLLRRHIRALEGIAATLSAQNALLTRLVDHLAPPATTLSRATLSEGTGLTHFDEAEAGIALAYIERTQQATGHTPDDDEVLIYLADEKTTDLAKRLSEREAELARLSEARR